MPEPATGAHSVEGLALACSLACIPIRAVPILAPSPSLLEPLLHVRPEIDRARAEPHERLREGSVPHPPLVNGVGLNASPLGKFGHPAKIVSNFLYRTP